MRASFGWGNSRIRVRRGAGLLSLPGTALAMAVVPAVRAARVDWACGPGLSLIVMVSVPGGTGSPYADRTVRSVCGAHADPSAAGLPGAPLADRPGDGPPELPPGDL
ncbi:hypothetical protein ACQ4WX_07990 [Streptomyces lasalocidi]